MKTANPFILQVVVTEIVSLALFGSCLGMWVGGLLAPLFGIALPFMMFLDRGGPIVRQLQAPALILLILASVVILAVFGRINRWVGHIALALFSVGSALCLLAIE
jgi:hypothetical protein